MAKGQRAAVLCALGDNLIYTVPTATTDTVTISFASVDNTPVTVKLYHVKQGNQGAIAVEDRFLLASPFTVDLDPILLQGLNVSSLDDIVVNASAASKLVVNINGSD